MFLLVTFPFVNSTNSSSFLARYPWVLKELTSSGVCKQAWHVLRDIINKRPDPWGDEQPQISPVVVEAQTEVFGKPEQ